MNAEARLMLAKIVRRLLLILIASTFVWGAIFLAGSYMSWWAIFFGMSGLWTVWSIFWKEKVDPI